MKILLNTFLGICALGCGLLLLFQGYLFPEFGGGLNVALRIFTGLFTQWLLLLLTRKPFLRAIPTMIALVVTVLGFFLMLSFPSWLGFSFGHFLSAYGTYAIGCLSVWVLAWTLPRLWRLIREILRRNFKR